MYICFVCAEQYSNLYYVLIVNIMKIRLYLSKEFLFNLSFSLAAQYIKKSLALLSIQGLFFILCHISNVIINITLFMPRVENASNII